MDRVVAIGEVMVELSFSRPERADVGYAGDTYNTALYLARLGRRCAYATALGRGDPFSRGVLAQMADEGLDRDLVIEAEGRLPGLYAIERDAAGERSFHYWRSEAPARDYLRLADGPALAAAIAAADLVYVTGISQAVMGAGLAARLEGARALAYDVNYRARLWPSPQAAAAAAEAIAPACRFVFVGEGEGQAIWGGEAPATAWAQAGAEVVYRAEDRSLRVLTKAGAEAFAAEPAGRVVDTTGAGDAFNAAYLDARLAGRPAAEAVAAVRRLAAAVIAHPGAIIPKAAVPL